MKVIYFHQHFSTPKGSSGNRSYFFAQQLIARGHAVTMVCGSYNGGVTGLSGVFANGIRSGIVDGIRVVELNLPYSNHDSFLRRTVIFLRFSGSCIVRAIREDYDLVFSTSTPLTAGIPGIVAAMVRRKPFVFEVRDLWPELPAAMGVVTNPVVLAAMSALELLSYRSARLCIGLAPGIVDGIVKRGVPRERVKLIPNAADLELFGGACADSWRPNGVARSDLMAVFTGTHGLANGLNAVLEAASVLKSRRRMDIKLVLVGDGKQKPLLMDCAEREGLDNVIFCPPVPKKRLSALMSSADVGLMILANVPAFYFGTSPNKFFDYIAAGKPVLCNYPGWIAEMLTKHSCGIAVPPGDADAFADALERAADNRSSLTKMGANGRRLAEESFDRRNLADRFVDALEQAASGGPTVSDGAIGGTSG